MSKILEVNDLCKSFVVKKRLLGENDVVSAVNHVSLGLEEGEVLGIVGESGCGKSTVARLLLHSIRPDSGTMKLCGKEYDMAHATGQDVQTFRKNMQMVFQNPYSSLNPKMNVLQNITFGLTANQVPRDEACRRAYRYLDAVGMQKSFLNKYPNSLSGGQRQRIGIARALAVEPEFIIADEPVSALDVSIQAQILNLMMDLKDEFGFSYLFIAHDLSVVKYICDRLAVMYLGAIMEMGDKNTLFNNPVHPYTRLLFSAVPTVGEEPLVEPMESVGEIPSPINLPSGCFFHERCPYATKECQCSRPQLREIESGHFVACHLCK